MDHWNINILKTTLSFLKLSSTFIAKSFRGIFFTTQTKHLNQTLSFAHISVAWGTGKGNEWMKK